MTKRNFRNKRELYTFLKTALQNKFKNVTVTKKICVNINKKPQLKRIKRREKYYIYIVTKSLIYIIHGKIRKQAKFKRSWCKKIHLKVHAKITLQISDTLPSTCPVGSVRDLTVGCRCAQGQTYNGATGQCRKHNVVCLLLSFPKSCNDIISLPWKLLNVHDRVQRLT